MTVNSSGKNRRQTGIHVLSHEVRTPLNGILGLLAMLEDIELPDRARALLSRIELSAEALNQQLNNAIEVQRIAAHKVIFAQRPYHLLQVVESSIRFYAMEAEAKGVELTLQFDPRLIGKTFVGDHERLLQILSALVSNAVKFTDSGKATLVVGLRKEKTTASQVVFRVVDTGVGIPAEEIPLVTQANYQIESVAKGRPPGTGAGLYIVSNLLALLASTLDIKSDQTGTQVSFTLDLPASKAGERQLSVTGNDTLVQLVSPASAQRELISSTLQYLGLKTVTHEALDAPALACEADLRLVDYRCAALNLVGIRHLAESSSKDSLCLLSTELEPATAMLAKGCRQWNTPYLPSDLVRICEDAGLIEITATASTDTNALPKLPDDLSPYTLLCVDDSPTNLIVLVGALTKLGFTRVLRAQDGEVAVQLMREHPEVDLVLMDFHMPRLNGAEAARQIRKEGSEAPILGVSALSEADLNSEIRDGDFETVITKPVKIATLSEQLARYLSNNIKG